MSQFHASGALPVYYQLKEILRREISSGVYPPGAQIPSEHDLVTRFQVSRATVRQALGDLVVDGQLVKRQGKGTFVAEPKLVDDLGGMATFQRQMDQRGLTTTVQVLSQHWVPAGLRERDLFGVADGDRIFRVVRIVAVQSEPVFVESWELPELHCPGLLDLDLSVFFNEILVGRYQLQVHRTVKYFEPALADAFEAATLGIRRGQPVLQVERIAFPPTSDKALFTCKWIVRGDRCRHLIRVGD